MGVKGLSTTYVLPPTQLFYFQGWATRNFSNNIDMFSSIKMIRRNKNMTMGIKLDLTQNS